MFEPAGEARVVRVAPVNVAQAVVAGLVGGVVVGNGAVVVLVDGGARGADLRLQGGSVRRAAGVREALPGGGAVRQLVGLLFLLVLEGVFDAAQGEVGVAQGGGLFAAPQAAFANAGEGFEVVRGLQRRVLAAVDHLDGLHGEFGFADAACAEFDVALDAVFADLPIDALFHVAEGIERGVVEVAAVGEGAQGGEELAAAFEVAGDGARFHQGVAFPVAAVDEVVLFHRSKRQRERPGLAEGAQAHVNAIDVAVGGVGVEGVDEALRQFAVPGFVFLRFLVVGGAGGAVFAVGVDEVDVGGEVEFAAAQFAHAEDEHRHRLAASVQRFAVARGQCLVLPGKRRADEGFGEGAGAGEEGGFVDEAVHYGVDVAHLAAVFVAPQLLHQRRFVFRRRVLGGVSGAVVFVGRRFRGEIGQPVGVAFELGSGVGAGLVEASEVGAGHGRRVG